MFVCFSFQTILNLLYLYMIKLLHTSKMSITFEPSGECLHFRWSVTNNLLKWELQWSVAFRWVTLLLHFQLRRNFQVQIWFGRLTRCLSPLSDALCSVQFSSLLNYRSIIILFCSRNTLSAFDNNTFQKVNKVYVYVKV